MGEWSEYFEDFPEENPANQVRKPDALAQVRASVTRAQVGKSAAQEELDKLILQSQLAKKASSKPS